MKRIISVLVFTIIITTSFNCGSGFIRANSGNEWSEYELLPSKVKDNGDFFYVGKLFNGTSFGAYWDAAIEKDHKFYYKILMQDLGWYKNIEGNWSASDVYAIRKKEGYIYVNQERKVGVYFNPSTDNYSVYKLKLK